MEISKVWVSLLWICSLCSCNYESYNYIVNGEFEFPAVAPSTSSYTAEGWTGDFFDLWNSPLCYGMAGQCMDLQRGEYENGYIEQTIVLPGSALCNLSFYQVASSTDYSWYIM